ncbi:MAG TPA: FxLYD domain-containing protein [Bryobacteraceae bacterium]|nr:FxLYD domain-containing protein [Bryobacteraceae bacterium]
MARSFRDIVESIVFAGMKPGQPAAQVQNKGRFGRLRARLDRYLSGGPAPSDPLYLTRRTPWQRIRSAAVVIVPCLIVGSFMVLALTNRFAKKTPMPKLDLSPGEIAAKMLPNIDNVKLDTNRDLDLQEVHIDLSRGAALAGTVVNKTNHSISTAEIVFDLTDARGSQLGAVSERLENLSPQKSQQFRLPIEQTSARFALVREVRTR